MPIIQPCGGRMPRRTYRVWGMLMDLPYYIEDQVRSPEAGGLRDATDVMQLVDVVKPDFIKYYKESVAEKNPYFWVGDKLYTVPKYASKDLQKELKKSIKAAIESGAIQGSEVTGLLKTQAMDLHPQLRRSRPATHISDPSIGTTTTSTGQAASAPIPGGKSPFTELPPELRLMVWEFLPQPKSLARRPAGGHSGYKRFFLGNLALTGTISSWADEQIGYLLNLKVYNCKENSFLFQDHLDLEGFLSGLSSTDASGIVTSTRKKSFERIVIHLVSLRKRITCSLVLPDETPSSRSSYHGLAQEPENYRQNTEKWAKQIDMLLRHHDVKTLRLVVHPGFSRSIAVNSPLVQTLLQSSFRVEELILDGIAPKYESLAKQLKEHMEESSSE
ncbi:MAG: hypothetical protein M1812_007532 [Candelaria pacifica]|nr:MAG: hypothetical protein M1812_007532 [Candelaria pacifica]